MTPNVSFLVLTEHMWVSHPSNPNFYRLNSDCTDWKTTILSILVTTIIEIDKDGDGNGSENGIDERKRHEIPFVSINMPVLAKIVRFLEYYKQEPK